MITLKSKKFKAYDNWVLIKPDNGNETYTLPNGMEMKIDIRFEKEVHAPVTGTVVSVPDRIYHATKKKPGMQWEVDMEVQVGDKVVYSYLAAVAALDVEEGKIIIFDDTPHFLIPYEEIYTVIRDNGPVPVNGYCLVSPIEVDASIQMGNFKLLSPETSNHISMVSGKVEYVSKSLIKKYVDGDGKPDIDWVRPGQTIVFDRACDLLAEYPLHASIENKKKFYRIQRRYIFGIMEEIDHG